MLLQLEYVNACEMCPKSGFNIFQEAQGLEHFWVAVKELKLSYHDGYI